MKKMLVGGIIVLNTILFLRALSFVLYTSLFYRYEPFMIWIILGLVVNIVGTYLFIKKDFIWLLFVTSVVFVVVLIDDVGLDLSRLVTNYGALFLFVCSFLVMGSLLVIRFIPKKLSKEDNLI